MQLLQGVLNVTSFASRRAGSDMTVVPATEMIKKSFNVLKRVSRLVLFSPVEISKSHGKTQTTSFDDVRSVWASWLLMFVHGSQAYCRTKPQAQS